MAADNRELARKARSEFETWVSLLIAVELMVVRERIDVMIEEQLRLAGERGDAGEDMQVHDGNGPHDVAVLKTWKWSKGEPWRF